MAMSPQELERMQKLEKLVESLLRVENIDFIKNLERRLNFLSGTFALEDATDVEGTGSPSSGQVLKYSSGKWRPGTDNV